MTGETHKAGGFLCSVVGFAILKHNDMLLPGVNEGLQWLMMYPFCMWGSVASDLDHNSQSIPMKDPPSRIVNGLLHITAPLEKACKKSGDTKSPLYKLAHLLNAHHRSWQTHSDLTLFGVIMLLRAVITGGLGLGVIDSLLLRIVLLGICLGLIAHFTLDMLTTDGVWSIVLVVLGKIVRKLNPRIKRFPQKIHLVPRLHIFRTGDKWEEFVRKVLMVLNVCAAFYLIWTIFDVAKFLPFEISLFN